MTATFGAILRAAREHRRWSQAALARAAGTVPSYVSRLESGERYPSQAFVDDLADALHATPAERDALRMSAGFAPAYDEDVERFRQLPPGLRRAVLAMVDELQRAA